MKHYIKYPLLVLLLFLFPFSVARGQAYPYKNASLPVGERVEDLLRRMTLEEKIAQIRHIHSWNIFDGQTLDEKKLSAFAGNIGWGFVEGFPLTGENCSKNMRLVQKYMIERTRLGIPVFTVAESLHGSAHEGSTIYPQNIALGSTFNPTLAYQKAASTSRDLHTQGMRQVLAPCIDVVRDLRWGRVEESYGEDPFLCGVFACAETSGYLDNGISPMLKHFGPHGNPLGGLNLASVECGVRDLHDVYLKPFEMVVTRLPVMAVMSTYNSWNRVPNSASRYLLTDILRKQWGFKGYVYSDWGAIEMLQNFHHTAGSPAECAVQSISAGLDVEASSECYPYLKELVEKGQMDINVIDEAVRRVLAAKFAAGLFEDPYGEKFGKQEMHDAESVALSRKIADESTVLLKNENGLLPLNIDRIRSIAVIGPNAAQVQFGDYTWSRNNKDGVTPLEGIKRLVGDKATVRYARGCSMMSKDTSAISEAVEIASQSDVALLFCGSSSASLARDYNQVNCGEGFDLHDLQLTGAQSELIRAVYETGKPVVLVLVAGKPFCIPWEKEHIPAILAQWYAGEQAGNSIADILFGKVNPSGKLAFSFPQSVGHLPAYYNHLPSDKGFYKKPGSYEAPGRDYVFSSPASLWMFGHGLSYTTFALEKMVVTLEHDSIRLKAQIRNTGNKTGKEVVQLYVRDQVSSVVTPIKQLRAFMKVELQPGESREVVLSFPVAELSLTLEDGRRLIEPGAFELQLGTASDRILLKQIIHIGADGQLVGADGQSVSASDNLPASSVTKSAAAGKEITVSGTVRDVQATLIDGVSIHSKTSGRELGRTDSKGRYKVRVSASDILVFEKKGYLKLEVPVNNHTSLNVKMTYGDNNM
ncbi:glycoside hydrolase family 3 N-terminal domain-containing protein [Bacteroides congonensis]|uniref:glycoside hydrolase family 3 N-terminal domain-containing protein n=1 Tax=Bacteroides congonensis TaxID=1871006 RepID=UPI00189D793E|nr:glycoside hydrolase family 3 N-terminal domain-containing protein [Bacteroides congonensis]